MNWKRELKFIAIALLVFLFFYFLPWENRFLMGLKEAVYLTHEYAREHIIFCLIPALFIAGAISVFLSQESVIKYLGSETPKILAYGVASVSGTILAVCSCTVLPLFAGIYLRGAGIGPATTFLFSGPAINVLAIVLTAKVLGLKLGVARAVAAIFGSILIGISMSFIFKREDILRLSEIQTKEKAPETPLYRTILFLTTLVGILIFATWGMGVGFWNTIYNLKWYFVILFVLFLGIELWLWFGVKISGLLLTALAVILAQALLHQKEISFLIGVLGISYLLYLTKGEAQKWLESTYLLGRQILPLLFLGVFIAGMLLGRQGQEALIPYKYIITLVGGNSIFANFFASISGALMYFATLTEVPILQGLLSAGMGYGPALALLLSGPAVSLPSLLVIKSILGTKKTLAYLSLVIIFSTIIGYIFGMIN